MARYWIRNRGRVQGPFSEERIQGLLRRGRFNRHFHVSEDRKNWYPAGEFPELFAGAGGPEPVDEESPFSSGGSPFDDGEDEDDLPPVSTPTSERKRKPSRRRASVPDDDEYEDDDDDEDDEDWEDDDEDWEDDEEFDGVFPALINWVERNVKVLIVVLLLVLGFLGWFFFAREDFTQDIADRDALLAVQSRIMQAYQNGIRADQWNVMMDSTEAELAPMITRLDANASAMDMVKQELLFIARDDLPGMMKELTRDKHDAESRVKIRFSLIDQMIESKSRYHDGTALMVRPQAPPSQPPASTPDNMQQNGQQNGGQNSDQSAGENQQPGQNGGQPSNNGFTPAVTSENKPNQ